MREGSGNVADVVSKRNSLIPVRERERRTRAQDFSLIVQSYP